MTAPHAKPRLYYDCPLKAAFMAKYFGMVFRVRKFGESADVDRIMFVLPEEIAKGRYAQYSVHSDSLHLLDPIEDDIILRTNGYCQQVGWQIGAPKAKAQVEAGATIIQRGGKAFMWPEEAA